MKVRFGTHFRTRVAVAVAALTADLYAEKIEAPDPTEHEISSLIEQLSHTEYSIRTEATRRLCAIGEAARQPLQIATASDDREAALRAARILGVLDQMLFAGVQVHLEADRTSFAWDQALDVRVILENSSKFPSRLPFPTKSDQSEASPEAGQVAAMIDVSDWLQVISPRGQEISLRTDEISDDPAVMRVVEDRIKNNALYELGPQGRVVLVLRQFNRGWARYPLLDRGEYRVTFRYAPPWADPVLAAQKAGEVVSNSITLNVEENAPPTVSREGVQAEMKVRQEEADLIAEIVNRHDHAILVNLNYGESPPFAQTEWIYERDGRRHVLSGLDNTGRTWDEFTPQRLLSLEAGGTMVLARVKVGELARALVASGGPPFSAQGSITFSYSNGCSRRWQAKEQGNLDKDPTVPPLFRSPLPRELISIRATSPPIPVSGAP